jgi:hypothetical protein
MEKQAFKSIVASLLITLMMVGMSSCDPFLLGKTDDYEYKYVTCITETIHYYPVEETSGGNTLKDGATGALIGGGASALLGGSITEGALIGGTIGAATTSEVKQTYRMKPEIIYEITFSDGTKSYKIGYNYLIIGDRVEAKNLKWADEMNQSRPVEPEVNVEQ